MSIRHLCLHFANRRCWSLGERGVTSIEFALVGPIFLLLVLGTLELGYMVFVQSVLDDAARNASRMVRTGQVQNSPNPQQTLQTRLCNDAASVIGCSNIIYQVQAFNTWPAAQTAANQPVQRDGSGNMVTNGVSPGTGKQIIVVQVSYNYPFFTRWVGGLLGGATNSAFLLSTIVFENEPFS